MGKRGPRKLYTEELRVPVRGEVKDRLHRLAERRHMTLAAVVREALDGIYEEGSSDGDTERPPAASATSAAR